MLNVSLKKIRQLIPFVLTSALLVACGGGSDTPAPTQTLSGVAAIGVPVVGGAVNVICSAGSGFSATTGSAGEWSVNTSGQTLPCAVQVSGGTVGGVVNTTSYQSMAISFGNINVTPLTSLVVAQLTGSNPVSWFRTPVFTGISADSIATAVRSVNTSLGLTSTLGSINPLTDAFKAQNGDKMDDILEALKTALASAAKTYPDLLAAASSRNYAGFTGFGTSFSSAHATITVVGSGGAGGTGAYKLTVEVSVSGVAGAAVVINGVPKPANETDFCSAMKNDSSLTQLTASGGTLTINSCSFNGTVGTISATLTTSVPVSLSLPYSVKYTYSN